MSWTQKTLGEIVNLKRGFDLPSSSRVDGPYPVFSSSGQTGTHSEAAVKGPCVVTGRYGTIGQVFFSDAACWPLNTSLYSTDFKGNDPKFVYYLLKTIPWRDYLTASAVPGINRNHVHLCPVCVPDHETQTAISGVLGLLDNKIELNTKLNGYLEELLLAKCAELENGVKEFCTVDNYCKRVYSGGTPSTKNASYWNGALPWLSSGETRARFIIGAEKTITPEGVRCSSTKLARRGNVVMASAGQGFTRGQTSMLLFDAYVNQSIAVMEPKEGCGSYLLFALARRYEELRAWSDSTSTRGSMSGKVLKQFALPRLSNAQLGQFETFANPLVQRIEINLRESKSLAALRDALLPKLMSGEIDVSKVDLTQLNSHLA
jgi:type I restriction enzyme S subunit